MTTTETKLPGWLDPATEIKEPAQPEAYKALDNNKKAAKFITYCVGQLLREELVYTPGQAFEVVGNLIAETGWGRFWNGWNFGGWKCTESWARSYRLKHGVSAPWFRAKGHVNSGDQPVVYYRGFVSGAEFIKQWMGRFVPEQGSAPTADRYYKTGLAFWTGGDWFRELCLSGYKGPVTQKNPDKSVEAHAAIVNRAKVIYAQWALGLTPDGVWGDVSKSTAIDNGLALNQHTGFLTNAAFEDLVVATVEPTPTSL